jgi:serine/threonine-protein kinase HipA
LCRRKNIKTKGEPSPSDIIELLRATSTDRVTDVDTFVDALGFNWFIAGTDAHAKNYSLLLAEGPNVRLAPLYDIASMLPYKGIDVKKIKLAMKIGDLVLHVTNQVHRLLTPRQPTAVQPQQN